MSLPVIPALVLLFTLSSTATSHYSSSTFSPSSSSPSQSPTQSEWQPARATYYAAADPRDTVGGACGFGDLKQAGYGMATVGLSETLFERGQICGACFQLRCVDDLRWCIRARPLSSRPPTSARPITDLPPTVGVTVTLPTSTSSSPLMPSRRSPSGRPVTCPSSSAGTLAPYPIIFFLQCVRVLRVFEEILKISMRRREFACG